MKQANDPGRDYRLLVRDGYDRCAEAFNAERSRQADGALLSLLDRLPTGARVLDLGCGAGVPVARAIAERCRVVGVDLSRGQLALARTQVPAATFALADMASCEFAPGSFDAVVSFYAIFHLPRAQHQRLFERIYAWLKPSGYLLASLAMSDEGGYTEEFFGVEMFWSNYDVARYRVMLHDCGFTLIDEGTLPHGYEGAGQPAEIHPIVLAQRSHSISQEHAS